MLELLVAAGALAAAMPVDMACWLPDRQCHLIYVMVGGLIGGLLQPVVATLNPKTPDPRLKHWFLSPFLGIAAAGITVYVIAKTDTDNISHLLFFSLLCGLAFPSILTSAVDQIGRRTEEAKKETGEIEATSKAVAPENALQVAEEIKAAVVKNPAASLTVAGQVEVEKSITQAVRNISDSQPKDASDAEAIADKLKEVATVAETAGYTGTAKVAAEKAEELKQQAATESPQTN